MALARRYGRARKPKPMTREQALRMLVSVMADALGGVGWDDPRLPSLCEGWMRHPEHGVPYDAAFVHAQADELIGESFDPRHLT
jgi:hypothetical protein